MDGLQKGVLYFQNVIELHGPKQCLAFFEFDVQVTVHRFL
jgi:hypothetical protein